ncbi:hypothetical protein JTB14_005432 [Gonioctena quinquepunctata]|nr:hypothetical protein JTB14_005432 [Gonioctena quinquepunctata]
MSTMNCFVGIHLNTTIKMKFYIVLCFLTVTCLSWADEISDCKCWSGYEPLKDEDGVVKCYGIMLFQNVVTNHSHQNVYVPEKSQEFYRLHWNLVLTVLGRKDRKKMGL